MNDPSSSIKTRILIVDDEEMIRESLSMILEMNHFSVDVAADGYTAISMIEQNAYALIILDLNMPGITGIEVLREMNRRAFRIPVICFTGFGSVASEQLCLTLGASAFMGKPVPIDTLLRTIRDLLSTV